MVSTRQQSAFGFRQRRWSAITIPEAVAPCISRSTSALLPSEPSAHSRTCLNIEIVQRPWKRTRPAFTLSLHLDSRRYGLLSVIPGNASLAKLSCPSPLATVQVYNCLVPLGQKVADDNAIWTSYPSPKPHQGLGDGLGASDSVEVRHLVSEVRVCQGGARDS